jgi:pimeloyl-ACP methyl ester carboxylesterase
MVIALILAAALAQSAAGAQSDAGTQPAAETHSPAGATVDLTIPPGANYDTAEFRLWYPPAAPAVQATVVLVPGSNGDGRPMADEPFWQEFATRHRLALVGCRFTDKPHDQSFIEHYVNVSQGSGQALLDALAGFADRTRHGELASAPLLLWGMSAGGEFNYEFVAWKPERVAAFVVNKGGIYYSALLPRAAREVPGILFVGEKDLDSRINMIAGLFAVNRRAGALWGFAEEPGVAHAVARSRDLAVILYAEVLKLRVGGSPMKPVDSKSGYVADLKARSFQPAADAPPQTERTAWLPTLAVAKAWQAVVSGQPFEP